MPESVFSSLPVRRNSPLPRIDYDDVADFQRGVVDQRRPCIVRGLVTRWPAYEKWSLEYLHERCRDMRCRVVVGLPREGVTYDYPAESFIQEMTFKALLRHITEGSEPCYYRRQEGSKTPWLDADLDFNQISPGETEGYFLWIGSAGTRTGLHFDMQDNVLCQIVGDKDVLLVDPRFSASLYPYSDSITKSRVVSDAPDLTRFPQFSSVEVEHAVLTAGEVLFIPNHWWHSVISLTPSVSVNHEFGQRTGWVGLAQAISAGGAGHWGRVSLDFLRFGLLRRSFTRRLADDAPFGKMLYDMISYSIRHRLGRLS